MRKYGSVFIILNLFLIITAYSFAEPIMQKEAASSSDAAVSGKLENGIRVVEVKAQKYKFIPDPIVVNLGEKVRLVVTSLDVTHGLAIDEFGINIILNPHQVRTVEFTANKKGAFRIYCSVYCGSGHEHMQANLIVK